MKVLSLFDWMSCWYLALKNLWVEVAYYASEIDKYAIWVSKSNFSEIIHIWDVLELDWKSFENIDLLIWWSPCQGFSFAWKRLNFEDKRSKLFFEFVRILKETKPKFFMLENVKMKKEWQEIITKELFWVSPILLNSSLVSAQNRQRLYWIWKLNKKWEYEKFEVWAPKDKKIFFKDILENKETNVSEKYIKYAKNAKFNQDRPVDWENLEKAKTLLASSRVLYQFWNNFKKLNSKEMCRLQNIPEDFFDKAKVSETQKFKMLWNWWTVWIIEFIFSKIILKLKK